MLMTDYLREREKDMVYANDIGELIERQYATYITDEDCYVAYTDDYGMCCIRLEWYSEENLVRDDTTTMHKKEFEKSYFRCDDCYNITHLDNLHQDKNDGNCYCPACYHKHSKTLVERG